MPQYDTSDQHLDYGAPVDQQPDEPQRLYAHPGFDFSGANMGGQSLQVCRGCHALVRDSDTASHRAWHEHMGG